MASLGELLGQYLLGLPPEAEVVEGTRGAMLPGAKYRLPDGSERWSLAAPQPMADALQALGAAGGRVQDPNAPEGYVSQGLIQRGADGLAGSATVGSLGVRAPRGALRSGAARNELPPMLARGFERPKRNLDFIGDENRPLLRDVIYDIAEETDPFYIRPAGDRPANAPFAKPKQREYESRAGNQVSRTPEEMTVSRDDVGFIEGTMDRDPQITFSEVIPEAKGTGVGSSMYRDWAKEAGVPFRSDAEVSAEAAAIYDKMFPKYGYNVLRNPRAEYNPQGGMSGTGGWYGPGGQHVYRVEPPGMKSDEFYANPLAGAAALMFDQPRPQGPSISDMGGRPIPPEEEAQRQALIRYLQGGN